MRSRIWASVSVSDEAANLLVLLMVVHTDTEDGDVVPRPTIDGGVCWMMLFVLV